MNRIKTIGVLTSGGDAPGMNAAIRAVTRTAIYNNIQVKGIRNGYQGMVQGRFKRMKTHTVSDIIQRGGTILKSVRNEDFKTEEGKRRAYENLKEAEIDAVIAIGGDGTFRGAREFTEEYNIPIIGIPGTIDNDLYGTDYTIGYDTALNTVVEAVDKIRDTASSHNRLFFVEVMGSDAGFLALRSAVACGAEAVLIPELQRDIKTLKEYLETGYKRKKFSNIILVAEGDETGGAFNIAKEAQKEFKEYDMRVTVLGHTQRGGSPSAYDRVMASEMGVAAVEALLNNQSNIMVGIMNREIVHIPFSKTIKHNKEINWHLFVVQEILAT